MKKAKPPSKTATRLYSKTFDDRTAESTFSTCVISFILSSAFTFCAWYLLTLGLGRVF